LRERGFIETTSVHQLRLAGATDPNILAALAELDYPCVLVTFDNKLPVEHGDEVRKSRVSLAIIDSRGQPPDLTQKAYLRDVVHRHADRFVEQEPGTAYRYRASRRRVRIDLG
jgi:hypothetical protein